MKRGLIFLNLFLVTTCLLFYEQSLGGDDWFEKGLSSLDSGQYEEATEAFSKAIEINPQYAEAYNNRGVAWHYRGDYDRAIADYTKALDVNPQYSEAYNNRGVAWYHKRDYDRAIADYSKAMDTNPRYADAFNNRGDAWFYKGNCAQAIADTTKALEINPQYADAYNQLAWVFALCPDDKYRNGAKALELAKKAVELRPEVDFLDTLAAAYAEAGKFEDAAKTEERVITLLKKGGRTDELAEYEERLESYKSKKPWRLKHIKQKRAYPYTIQVSSDRRKESSYRVAMGLRKQGGLAFTSHAFIPGKGNWYRVFIGVYGTLEEAQKAASGWKKGKFPDAWVVKLPYAVQVSRYDEDQKAKELEADLQKKGYISYSTPDRQDNGKMRLLIGAFKAEKEATKLSKQLKEEGFQSKVVFR
jgi:tetratricopeptide (TPR) repeat protein